MFETGSASEFQTDLSRLLHLSRDTFTYMEPQNSFPIHFLAPQF